MQNAHDYEAPFASRTEFSEFLEKVDITLVRYRVFKELAEFVDKQEDATPRLRRFIEKSDQ
jgi:hypothetical protein